jgi:hypothetical protein
MNEMPAQQSEREMKLDGAQCSVQNHVTATRSAVAKVSGVVKLCGTRRKNQSQIVKATAVNEEKVMKHLRKMRIEWTK